MIMIMDCPVSVCFRWCMYISILRNEFWELSRRSVSIFVTACIDWLVITNTVGERLMLSMQIGILYIRSGFVYHPVFPDTKTYSVYSKEMHWFRKTDYNILSLSNDVVAFLLIWEVAMYWQKLRSKLKLYYFGYGNPPLLFVVSVSHPC